MDTLTERPVRARRAAGRDRLHLPPGRSTRASRWTTSEVLARHPEFAAELADFFAERADLQGLAAPLREVARAAAITSHDADGPSMADAGERAGTSCAGTQVRYLRRLRAAGGDRAGRHGRGLQGPPAQPEPGRRPEDDPAGQPGLRARNVRRFQLEAEAAAKLDHPHIVPIYEVGEHDGCRTSA